MIPKAVRFIKEFRTGSSLPLLVTSDQGELYVIKLHGSGEGKPSMLTGFIGSKIAALLGVSVLSELLIWFDPEIIPETADPEIIELAERSAGLNIATRFLTSAIPFNKSTLLLSPEERDVIFLTDLLLMNIDRTPKNPNILCAGEGIYCYDFAMSMNVRNLFEKQDAPADGRLLPLLRRHLFWQQRCPVEKFITRVKQITIHELKAIVDELPYEWYADYSAESLTAQLYSFLQNTDALQKKLDLLSQLADESEEELRAKNLRSRQAFFDKFGKI